MCGKTADCCLGADVAHVGILRIDLANYLFLFNNFKQVTTVLTFMFSWFAELLR